MRLLRLALCLALGLGVQSQARAASTLAFQPDSSEGPLGHVVLAGTLTTTSDSVPAILYQNSKAIDTVMLRTTGAGAFQADIPFRQGPHKPLTSDTLWLKASGRDTDVVVAVVKLTGETLRDTLRISRPALKLTLVQRGIKDSLRASLSLGAQADTSGKRTLAFQTGNEGLVYKTTSDTFYIGSISSLLLNAATTSWIRNEIPLRATFVDPVYGDTAIDSILVPVYPRRLTIQPLGKDTTDTLTGPRGSFLIKVQDSWEPKDSLAVTISFPDSVGDSTARTVWLHRNGTATFVDTLHVTQASSASGDTLAMGRAWPIGATVSVQAALLARSPFPVLLDTSWIARPHLTLELSHLFDTNEVLVSLQGGIPDADGKATVTFECPAFLSSAPSSLSLTPRDSLFWLNSVPFKDQVDEWNDSVSLVGRFIDPLYRDTVLDTLKLWAPWFPGKLDIDVRNLSPREREQANITLYEHDPDSSRVDTFHVTMPDAAPIALIETGKHTGIYWTRVDATAFDSTWLHRLPRLAWTVPVHYQDPRHPADTSTVVLTLKFDVPFFEMGLRHPIVERSHGGLTTNPGHSFGLEPVQQPDTAFTRDVDPGQGVWVRAWDRTLVTMCLYDNLGVLVTQWSGEIAPPDGDDGGLFLLRWDGRGSNGRPAPRGVYLLRTYARRDDGRRAVQQIYRIGLD